MSKELEIKYETPETFDKKINRGYVHHKDKRSPIIQILFDKHSKELFEGDYLDLGGLQGANSIYALQEGMRFVINIDFSNEAIKYFCNRAKEKGFKNNIEGICQDLIDFKNKDLPKNWDENFSLVSTLFVLQNLEERDDWKGLVYKMQQCTKVGGFNLISVPKGETSSETKLPYVFSDGEIDQLYNNPGFGEWELDVLSKKNVVGNWLGGVSKTDMDRLVYRRVR